MSDIVKTTLSVKIDRLKKNTIKTYLKSMNNKSYTDYINELITHDLNKINEKGLTATEYENMWAHNDGLRLGIEQLEKDIEQLDIEFEKVSGDLKTLQINYDDHKERHKETFVELQRYTQGFWRGLKNLLFR